MKPHKYGAKKALRGAIVFASQAEARRYDTLSLLERAGQISGLTLQEKFELVPPQIIDGKKERAVSYVADFSYYDQSGKKIVEDVKGMKTREYILKRKLLHYRYGVAVKEVTR